MTETVKVIKSEVIARFEEGNTKEEVRKKYYPAIPIKKWEDIWEKCGLKNKKAPTVIIDFVENDESEPEHLGTPFDEEDTTNPDPYEGQNQERTSSREYPTIE